METGLCFAELELLLRFTLYARAIEARTQKCDIDSLGQGSRRWSTS